jgi:hypothetical protein
MDTKFHSILTDETDGRTIFDMEIVSLSDTRIEFNVYEVTSWNSDDTHSKNDSELYLRGYIKWDGCSHFWFGDKNDEDEHGDGYIHLCGYIYFKNHIKLMELLFKYADEHISNFDREVADYENNN